MKYVYRTEYYEGDPHLWENQDDASRVGFGEYTKVPVFDSLDDYEQFISDRFDRQFEKEEKKISKLVEVFWPVIKHTPSQQRRRAILTITDNLNLSDGVKGMMYTSLIRLNEALTEKEKQVEDA